MKSTRQSSNAEEKERPRFTRMHRIRYEQNIPLQFANNLIPLNTFEQKDRFLRRKITPEFHLNIPTSELESALLDASGNITFTLFREASRILNIVCRRFKSIDNFIEESFGPRISIEQATEKITEYIKESNLPTNLDVIWCEDLVGSALMCSTGIDKNGNIPRQRKFTMLLKTNEENTYLRERGIMNLMDHEIGTHYHRSFNEGLQPWYGKRDIYGLDPTNTNDAIKTEEGLACIHTILKARHRYLGVPALLYYGSCMAEYLPFKDLFEHLGKYISNEEQRWKHCMRIKRCLPSQDLCGGYGKDQRYFEGAVTILRQQANIDFNLLMAGKLALNELDRVRRCAITAAVRYPTFMQNREKYLATLRQIARLNGIPIAKRTQERNRPRSLVITGDQKTSSDFTPAACSASFTEAPFKTPPNISSLRSTHTSTSEEERSKNESERSRSKSCTEHMQTPIPQTLQTEDVVEEHRSDPNCNDLTEERPNQSTSSDDSSSESSVISAKPKQTKRTIKKRIIRSLINLQLPLPRSSNTDERKPTVSSNIKTDCLPRIGIQHSKQHLDQEYITMENGMSSLPRGVCGCRLFTHGSLKPNTAEQPHAKHGKRSKSASDDISTSENTIIPVILEIDLRHPLIGV